MPKNRPAKRQTMTRSEPMLAKRGLTKAPPKHEVGKKAKKA